MGRPKHVSLEEIQKQDVAICPECGVLFVKTVKGEDRSFWSGATGIYCPVCESLVVRKGEKSEW